MSSLVRSQRRHVEEWIEAARNVVRGRCMEEPTMGRCTLISGRGYLYVTRKVRAAFRRANRPSSPSSRTSAQSYPRAKSVRGSSLPASAGGFWRRADTRVLLPVEGWPRTRIFFAGIERDEDTELRMLDQRSSGGAFGEDGRESTFIVVLTQQRIRRLNRACPLPLQRSSRRPTFHPIKTH